MNRRRLIQNAGSWLALGCAEPVFGIGVPHRVMSHIERVDAALAGKAVDRPPYTLYRRRQPETQPFGAHNELSFHKDFNTDIVIVANPYEYPTSGNSQWFDIKTLESPFPDQLITLESIRKGLKKKAYFVDAISSPFTTAWHLFNKRAYPHESSASDSLKATQLQAFREFQNSNEDAWKSALEAITQSTVNHIAKAKEIGVSGCFVNVINATSRFGTAEEYERFSRPYDQRVFSELADTKLTVVSLLDLDHSFINRLQDFNASVVHYSSFKSGISIAEIRKRFSGAIMGGVDETTYGSLHAGQIRKEWTLALEQAGPRFIVAPGGPISPELSGRQLGHLQDSLSAW